MDIFGLTALDTARSKNQDAVEAIILAKGGLPGDDPRVQSEHDAVKEFVENSYKSDRDRRKLNVLEVLPESKLRHTVGCVEAALQIFMEVCARTFGDSCSCREQPSKNCVTTWIVPCTAPTPNLQNEYFTHLVLSLWRIEYGCCSGCLKLNVAVSPRTFDTVCSATDAPEHITLLYS